jgi:hypothetical protein
VLSLTHVWLLSICGAIIWLLRGDRPDFCRHLETTGRNIARNAGENGTVPFGGTRLLAALIGGVSLVCLAFYLWWPGVDRNYGGMTSGFRWVFWMAPMWLVVMLPSADAVAGRRWTRIIALLLLAASVFSASYPTWNPWAHPWAMNLMKHMGWM